MKSKTMKNILGVVTIAQLLGSVSCATTGLLYDRLAFTYNEQNTDLKAKTLDKIAIVQQDEDYNNYLKEELDKLHIDLNLGKITTEEYRNSTKKLVSDENLLDYAKNCSNGVVSTELQKYINDSKKYTQREIEHKENRNSVLPYAGVLAGTTTISALAYLALKHTEELEK